MLRTFWTAQPSAAGAFALVRMCANIMGAASDFRHDIYGDVAVRRAERQAAEAMTIVLLRLDQYARQIQRAVHLTQPGSVDRISMLTANVIGPILDGIYPPEYPEGVEDEALAEAMRARLTPTADGRWKGLGDAATSARVFNAFSRAWLMEKKHASETWLPDSLRDWLSQVERDLEPSVPGEEPTTYDKVNGALEAAKDLVVDVAQGIGKHAGKALIWGAFGIGAVVGGFLIVKGVSARKERALAVRAAATPKPLAKAS